MIQDGADFIDIGGESTRPGSKMVLPADEAIRVLPIIQKLSSQKFKLSLDTRNSSTMELGLLSGVNIIKSIQFIYSILPMGIQSNLALPLCLFHIQSNLQLFY